MVSANYDYSDLIPDDGLINDFELGLRLQSFELMDDLLNHDMNQALIFGVLERMETDV